MSGERRALTHLVGLIPDRDWRSMVQLAQLGLFPSSEAARAFCRKHRHHLVLGKKGRLIVVDKRSLDRYLEARALSA